MNIDAHILPDHIIFSSQINLENFIPVSGALLEYEDAKKCKDKDFEDMYLLIRK